MIDISKTEVVGWEHAVRGARNPMNSWKRSDSHWDEDGIFRIGENDWDLLMRLRNAGTADHRKYLRMIVVYCDITAPLYWFKELDTYKVGTVANSCSTMHKIAAKEFTLDDFSHEHLDSASLALLDEIIFTLNASRERFNNKALDDPKQDWWQMIQLLPSSYNQKRTVMLNYEVLANIYKSRRGHKLDEWHDFLEWIEELPYAELIIGDKKDSTKGSYD